MILHSRLTSKRAAFAVACTFATVAIALPGQSQAGNSISAASSGTVVKPIDITKSADLSFGKFVAGPGGTLTVSTSGARSNTGVLPIPSSATTAAKFDVTGEESATYTITIPASVTLTSQNSDTMSFTPINDMDGSGATSGTITSGSLDGTGKQSIFVGGILTVAAGQAPGSYAGSVTIQVDYN